MHLEPDQVLHGINMHMFVDQIHKYVDFAKLNGARVHIYDIGSRDGQDARFLHSRFPDTDVYAFEAHPEEYRIHAGANSHINWITLGHVNFATP